MSRYQLKSQQCGMGELDRGQGQVRIVSHSGGARIPVNNFSSFRQPAFSRFVPIVPIWQQPYYYQQPVVQQIVYQQPQPVVPTCVSYPNPLPNCAGGAWTWKDATTLCCTRI